MMASSPREVTFTNSKQESFRLYIFDSQKESPAKDAPVLFCVHGAGMSGKSFFKLARYLRSLSTSSGDEFGMAPNGVSAGATCLPASHSSRIPPPGLPPTPKSHSSLFHSLQDPPLGPSLGGASAGFARKPAEAFAITIVSVDLRCHGESTYEGGESGLTIEVLIDDFLSVLAYAQRELLPQAQFFVLGHSLGGAVVAKGLSLPTSKPIVQRVSGVILVDVVEGTAKQSLKYMPEFIQRRPTQFASVKDAEEWFLKHGGMNTVDGAATSVPPLLRQEPETGCFVWRTNLSKLQDVWEDWFKDLDKAFVGLPVLKMLCLANTERLDKELMVAQMQGKFQLEVIGNSCGHYVMDDAPAELSLKIRRFVSRIVSLSEKLNSRVDLRTPVCVKNLAPSLNQ